MNVQNIIYAFFAQYKMWYDRHYLFCQFKFQNAAPLPRFNIASCAVTCNCLSKEPSHWPQMFIGVVGMWKIGPCINTIFLPDLLLTLLFFHNPDMPQDTNINHFADILIEHFCLSYTHLFWYKENMKDGLPGSAGREPDAHTWPGAPGYMCSEISQRAPLPYRPKTSFPALCKPRKHRGKHNSCNSYKSCGFWI